MSLKTILTLIFLISLAGTLTSLYFWYYGDPIANVMSGDLFNLANALEPCSLCRYARIALYPMVMISLIWLITDDDGSVKYLTPLSVGWLLLTGYQIILQAWVVSESWFCIPGSKSCAIIDWQYFWVTIPMLACAAFVLILGLCIAHHMKYKKD
jgi:disulfide bond formation protein DsbB